MGDVAWSFLGGALIVAIIYMLARPGSPAAAVISDTGAALTSLVKAAVS